MNRVTLVQGLFVQYQPVIRSLVLSLLPDFDRVDDVVQETFLTVTRKADAYQPGTNFTAWAGAIARYKVLEVLRRGPLEFQTLSENVIEALGAAEPEPMTGSDHQLRLLDECIGQLAPQARRAIDLRYQQAHRPPEIASQMGWTVSAVNVALSRARTVLRECMERKLAAES